MRFLGLALAGSLALMVPVAAHSAAPGSNIGPAMKGPASGVVQGSNSHPAPGGGGGGWHPPHWGPGRFNGGGSLWGAGSSHLLGLGSQRRRL